MSSGPAEVGRAHVKQLSFSRQAHRSFAARSAPPGTVPPEVVDAVFYDFAPGEVAWQVPWV